MTHPTHINRAKELRKDMSKAERLFWWCVRDNKLGFQFRRQYSIPPYFADFVCLEKKIVIELDGWQHGSNKDVVYDNQRTDFLKSYGWTIIRIPNSRIYKGLDVTIRLLKKVLNDEIMIEEVFVEKYGEISNKPPSKNF